MTILVTGGCGFIGSNFVRNFVKNYNERVIVLDSLTYAGRMDNLTGLLDDVDFCYGDIGNKHIVTDILKMENITSVVNFAAESHVDNSIKSSMPFVMTNVVGTVNLLDCIRDSGKRIKFLHVSTDEVFGSLGENDGKFNITTKYAPRSPYSASKAASDHFVMAYYHTFGMDVTITNCSNNYGPRQHPEKLIPTIIRKALAGQKIPVYGDGMNIRDWLHVDDHCAGILAALHSKESKGKQFLFGGHNQIRNIEMVQKILEIMEMPDDLISFVEDRKGHDYRYDIDTSESEKVLGWKPTIKFEDGLYDTILWYKNKMEWIESCLRRSGSY